MRAEYAYDLKSHHGEFLNVMIFAVDSVAGRCIGFDCLADNGAMFARLPISAFVHRQDAPDLPLELLQLWSCFSYSIEEHEFGALRHARCDVLLKDRKWYTGNYMTTFSWTGSAYAEQAGDGGFKRGHLIQLQNGCYCIQPGNRIRWYDPSHVTKQFPERPDYLTNNHNWFCEQTSKWATEDSERQFYETTPVDNR